MTFRTNIAGLTSSLTHARVRQSYETLLRASYHIGLTRLALGIRTKQQRCTVLLYHGVDIRTEGAQEIGGEWYVDLAEFRRQMEFLQRHFRLLSLGEAVSHIENGTPFPRGSAVVSFDDGYRNNLVQAYPVLNEFGIPFSRIRGHWLPGEPQKPLVGTAERCAGAQRSTSHLKSGLIRTSLRPDPRE